MKRIYLLIISFFLISNLSSAQKELNIWCFGTNCGLDFNSGSPVVFTGVAMNQSEGCSSIADSTGSLLFYTSGVSVWNKNHAVMTNGTGLWGGSSSAQSALILKQPGNSNIYYIFTTAQANGANGFAYSIVDMSLSGGLGSVTTKNVQLFTTSAEKVCATHHSNGTDIWIMGHEMGTDGFRAYLLTSTGLNAVPVITNIGTVYTTVSNNHAIGCIKFSHDGKRLAACLRWMATLELFDFDNATGKITNMIFSTPALPQGPYETEFSPDNRFLYMTITGTFQFDLSSGNAATIIASKDSVGPGSYGLQLATDMKIYGVENQTSTLNVINSPNSKGAACGYSIKSVPLGTATSRFGLPNVLFDIPTTNQPPVAHITSSDTFFCDESGKCIDFFDHSTGNPTAWQWFFPGATPDTSTVQNPTNICYYTPGTYAVKLIVTNANGSDTLNVAPLITFGAGASKPVLTLSGDTIFSSPASSYQWYFNGSPIPGATDSFYVATLDGSYNVYITDNIGCGRLGDGILFTLLPEVEHESIGVYPNPVRDELVIYGLPLTAKLEIELFNIVGERIYRDVLTGKEKRIDTKPMPAGIYFLSIHSDSFTTGKKIIILK